MSNIEYTEEERRAMRGEPKPNELTIEYDELDERIIDALACDTRVSWSNEQRKAARKLITRYGLEQRKLEAEKLLNEQKDYVKAVSGHINNTNTKHLRGGLNMAKGTIRWLENRITEITRALEELK